MKKSKFIVLILLVLFCTWYNFISVDASEKENDDFESYTPTINDNFEQLYEKHDKISIGYKEYEVADPNDINVLYKRRNTKVWCIRNQTIYYLICRYVTQNVYILSNVFVHLH